MSPYTPEEIIAQFIVDTNVTDKEKLLTKEECLLAYQRRLEFTRAYHAFERNGRLQRNKERGRKDRPDYNERDLKKEIKWLEGHIPEVEALEPWEIDLGDAAEHIQKWTGGSLAGMLFNRGRSTISRWLHEAARIEEALAISDGKPVPILTDDNGESSYNGWTNRVFYSVEDYLECRPDTWHLPARNAWQWMAGMVAWDRIEPWDPRGCRPNFSLTRHCDPGWTWIQFNPEYLKPEWVQAQYKGAFNCPPPAYREEEVSA